MIEKIQRIFKEFKEDLMKEENTWMWSLVAIFALLFTALLLLFTFLFAEGIPN